MTIIYFKGVICYENCKPLRTFFKCYLAHHKKENGKIFWRTNFNKKYNKL